LHLFNFLIVKAVHKSKALFTLPPRAPNTFSIFSPLPSLPLYKGIDLENIVYYKDDTHYFVMTAKKKSLLKKGVIKQVTHTLARTHTHVHRQTKTNMMDEGSKPLCSIPTYSPLPPLQLGAE